jgi:uncharacterized protein YuzE
MTCIDYDPVGDSLFIRVKNDTYAYSEHEDNLITDYNCQGEVIGFEVLSASKFFDDVDVSGWPKLLVQDSRRGFEVLSASKFFDKKLF